MEVHISVYTHYRCLLQASFGLLLSAFIHGFHHGLQGLKARKTQFTLYQSTLQNTGMANIGNI